jgi:acetolactate synthase-1/2/3 large subunit
MAGQRFGLSTDHGSGRLIPRDAVIIQIDPDAREFGRLQPIELGVLADPARAFDSLSRALPADAAPTEEREAWRAVLRQHVEQRLASVRSAVVRDDRIHPLDAVDVIAATVPPGSVIAADGALTYLWLSETIALARPSAYLCHGYLGSMGVGVGIALGAQAADPGGVVVLVTGDGSVGYSLGEFDTMVRAGLPVVVIVLNNRAWGATLHAQEMLLGPDRIVNNRLENGSYSQVARALGADGHDVTDVGMLAQVIRDAIAARRPACIEVHVSLAPIPPEERVIMGMPPF